jgi:hypothetical protein
MPFVWAALSGLAGIVTGLMYEKESGTKTVAEVAKTTSPASDTFPYDKLIMAAAGVAAFYIYRKVK